VQGEIGLVAAHDFDRLSVDVPPRWARALVGDPRLPWIESDFGLAHRSVAADGFALVSVRAPEARELDAAAFQRRVTEVYRLFCQCALESGTANLVRVWNFIPGILEPLGHLQHRYMAFNAGRFAAFEEWYRGKDSFDQAIATASGVGHVGDDLIVHCLACARAGAPVENPRQVPSYRYSKRYGPLPPCFARATRLTFDTEQGPVLLVGGTASIRGEETVHPGQLEEQAEETVLNLAALVRAAVVDDAARELDDTAILQLFEHLRVYYVCGADAPRVGEIVSSKFFDVKNVEIAQADLCRSGLLIEIEGLARLVPCREPATELVPG
jgi:chorismate lyase/3-hydroxybenzoate synthase